MAYIVTAYVVMVHIDISYIVRAYIVMAYIVKALAAPTLVDCGGTGEPRQPAQCRRHSGARRVRPPFRPAKARRRWAGRAGAAARRYGHKPVPRTAVVAWLER